MYATNLAPNHTDKNSQSIPITEMSTNSSITGLSTNLPITELSTNSSITGLPTNLPITGLSTNPVKSEPVFIKQEILDPVVKIENIMDNFRSIVNFNSEKNLIKTELENESSETPEAKVTAKSRQKKRRRGGIPGLKAISAVAKNKGIDEILSQPKLLMARSKGVLKPVMPPKAHRRLCGCPLCLEKAKQKPGR